MLGFTAAQKVRKYTLSVKQQKQGLQLSAVTRCDWCRGDALYESYHDREWGVPCRDSGQLFEFLLLEGAQAGLSWITILRKRENYRRAYDEFNPELIARWTDADIAQRLTDEGIIRNRLKVAAARQNARAFLALEEQGDGFTPFLWSFVGGSPRQNSFESHADVPASTPASRLMSKSLKKAGFSFVGETICYALMQATGMVNDHLVGCFRHGECRALA